MLPLHTDRLTVRMMRSADLPTFVAYRNDPDVARYQAWELPYPAERAVEFLAIQDALDEPVVGQWTQLAIERDGITVGDLALYLHDDGARAEIGFTLATEHQGKGYAREAAAALVDALFDHTGVHRIEASLDPANVASMRVLEAIGMQYECLARGAFEWRGDWVDDLRYAMLAADRVAWRERDLSPALDVRFEEITSETAYLWGQVVTHWSQRRMVAPVEQSFRDALFPEDVNGVPAVPWMRGVLADGERAGFVMLAEVTDTVPHPFLWRLLIDRRHQRRAIGERVISLLREQLLAEGHSALDVSWHEGPGSPRRFYERLGFVPTGNLIDGETEARLTL